MTAIFLSDVHLSAARPGIVDDFTSLLEGPARQAETLYILGDLFDLWLGDDDVRDPHPAVVEAVAATTAAGVAIRVVPGNHDFLLGDRFERDSGARLLDEPCVVELGSQRVVLLHGDTLCTRDVDYQAFRRYARDPANQREFLDLPMTARIERAATLRQTSREQTELKPDDIMDVTPADVETLFASTGASVMIHGHTHRPAVHTHDIEGRVATRYVLADWYARGSYLRFEDGRFESIAIDG